jgi:hypothetical protein
MAFSEHIFIITENRLLQTVKQKFRIENYLFATLAGALVTEK